MQTFRDGIYQMFLDILSGNLEVEKDEDHPLRGVFKFEATKEEDYSLEEEE